MKKEPERRPDGLDMSDGRPDFGSRSALLPEPLTKLYFVESSFEEEVATLVANVPGRAAFLAQVAPKLYEYFGCDARLMLAAPWSLFEPIGPVLHVVIYTELDPPAASRQLKQFERDCVHGTDFGVVFDPNANAKLPPM